MTHGFLLFFGLFVLIKAAGYLVDGASVTAARFGISPLVIGLSVMSFGTSMPELLVLYVSKVSETHDIPTLEVANADKTIHMPLEPQINRRPFIVLTAVVSDLTAIA